jgi:hypothetical protein
LGTAQTALAFCLGLYNDTLELRAAIHGLGDSDQLMAIKNAAYRAARKNHHPPFEALLIAHECGAINQWSRQAGQAVQTMFDKLSAGNRALGFFPSPMVEFASLACGADKDKRHPNGWDNLRPLEGLEFNLNRNRIKVVRKISVKTDAGRS